MVGIQQWLGRDKSCKFLHDPAALDNKSARCWRCSATTHTKKECPTREGQHQERMVERKEEKDGKNAKSESEEKKDKEAEKEKPADDL